MPAADCAVALLVVGVEECDAVALARSEPLSPGAGSELEFPP